MRALPMSAGGDTYLRKTPARKCPLQLSTLHCILEVGYLKGKTETLLI
jgi:hypothetical protein